MAQPDVTTADQVAAVLKNTKATDPRFVRAYRDAEEAVRNRCRWDHGPVDPLDPEGEQKPAPDDLVYSVILRTARNLARLNSPDGLIGMGELGVMRVAVVDRDVNAKEAPYRRVVFG